METSNNKWTLDNLVINLPTHGGSLFVICSTRGDWMTVPNCV